MSQNRNLFDQDRSKTRRRGRQIINNENNPNPNKTPSPESSVIILSDPEDNGTNNHFTPPRRRHHVHHERCPSSSSESSSGVSFIPQSQASSKPISKLSIMSPIVNVKKEKFFTGSGRVLRERKVSDDGMTNYCIMKSSLYCRENVMQNA